MNPLVESVDCGEQETMAGHLLLDCDLLRQVRFTMFGLVSNDGGIHQENMVGCGRFGPFGGKGMTFTEVNYSRPCRGST